MYILLLVGILANGCTSVPVVLPATNNTETLTPPSNLCILPKEYGYSGKGPFIILEEPLCNNQNGKKH